MADGLDVSEMMKRAVQANARFYKGWMDLTLEYVRGMSAILGGEPENTQPIAEMDTSAGALVLEGEAGETVRGAFLVSNDLGRTLTCEFVSSAFNDTIGARIVVKPVFDPFRLELAPGEQRVIQVTMTIDSSLKASVGYAGEFSIAGMDGFAVPVVLRRQHRADDAAIAKDDATREDSTVTSTADSAVRPPRRAAAKQAKPSKGRTGRGSAVT